MPQIDTTIPVSMSGVSAGQTVNFAGEVVSSLVITNNSGFSVQYSTGGAWITVANGASASIGGVDPASFRIRKAALDASPGYPLQVGMSWVYADDEVRAAGQPGGGMQFYVGGDAVGTGGGITSYTWATKPAATAVPAGTLIQITGATLRGLWESDGTYWRYLKSVSLLANGNPGTTTVGITETVLAAIPLPAGCLADVGKMVAEFLVSFQNNANIKEIQLRLGGTGVDGTSLFLQNFTTTQKQALRVGFMNRNLVNAQIQTTSEYTSGYGGTTTAVATAAVNTAVDQVAYITGRCAVGTDTITLQAIDANLV